jgi:hypothetical protein
MKVLTFFSNFIIPLFSTTSDRTLLHFAASAARAKRVFASLFHVFFPNTTDLRDPLFSFTLVRTSAAS